MSSLVLQRWEYRETNVIPTPPSTPVDLPTLPKPPAPPPGFTEEQVAARIQHTLQEAEHRWVAAAEQSELRRRERLETTLVAFAGERARYFREAEAEVVHLALAIARKILGREAALDPDLLAGMVRVSLDRIDAGTVVKLRVPPAELLQWQQSKMLAGSPCHCELSVDPSLAPGDCIVETGLGAANFGLDVQLKQIEQGMLDLLTLRPSLQPQNIADACAKTGEKF